jgi:hypothetical protein
MKVPITYSARHAKRVQVMQRNEQLEMARTIITNLLMIALLFLLAYALILVLAAQGWN